MRTLIACAAIWLLTVSLAAAPPEETQAIKADMVQLEGKWAQVSGEQDGKPMRQALADAYSRSVVDGVSTVILDGTVIAKLRLTIDPSKTPKTIDYTVIDGIVGKPGDKAFGIYELGNGTAKFCVAPIGQQRPTQFSTQESEWTQTVWRKK